MANMRHEVEIDAPPEKVFEAITTQTGASRLVDS